jgi:hypothetical protein
MNIEEDHQIFTDESAAIDYLLERRVLHYPLQCSKCSCFQFEFSPVNHRLVKCRNPRCQFSSSLLNNSFFHQSPLKLNFILTIAYHWLLGKSPFEIAQLARQTIGKIQPRIAKLKNILAYDLDMNCLSEVKLGGDNIPLHIYKFKCPHLKEMNVICGIERISGGSSSFPSSSSSTAGATVERRRKYFAFFTPFHNPSNLLDFIQYQVEVGSVITTNCWDSFSAEELFQEKIVFNSLQNRYEILSNGAPLNETLSYARECTIQSFQSSSSSTISSASSSSVMMITTNNTQPLIPRASTASQPTASLLRGGGIGSRPTPQQPSKLLFSYSNILSQIWKLKYQSQLWERLLIAMGRVPSYENTGWNEFKIDHAGDC